MTDRSNVLELASWSAASADQYIASSALDLTSSFFASFADCALALVILRIVQLRVPDGARPYILVGIVVAFPLIVIASIINLAAQVLYDAANIRVDKTLDQNPDADVPDTDNLVPLWTMSELCLRILMAGVYLVSAFLTIVVAKRMRADKVSICSLLCQRF